jgi:uncharacterized protein YndB with AHSA1/START domain
MPAIDDAVPVAHRELTLVRVFNAPRGLVFAAFTDPDHLARWWGPHGFTNPVCEFDARAGGALRIHMRAPDGHVYVAQGIVRDIVPPERLVFTIAVQESDGSIRLENLTTVTFAEVPGAEVTGAEGTGAGHARRTKLTLQVRVLQATAAAAANLAGMEVGWSQSLERLGELVAKF